MLTSGQQWAIHFFNICSPLSGEIGLTSRHPEATNTLRNVGPYQAVMEELKDALMPELELIQSRIHAPAKELQGLMKQMRKSITKRDHKVRSLVYLISALHTSFSHSLPISTVTKTHLPNYAIRKKSLLVTRKICSR